MKKEIDETMVVLAKQKVRLIKMIQKSNCILVYSDMNTWIDFCILVSDEDFNKAMEVTAKAYDDWWELPDAQFEPLADWVSICLTENDIEFEIYFKNEEEE